MRIFYKLSVFSRQFFYVIFLLFIQSCISYRYTSTKPSKVYTDFFVGDGVMQYFIKPLHFKSYDSELLIDFAFRDSCKQNTLTYVNFSIITENINFKVNSVFLLTDRDTLSLRNITKLFSKVKGKRFEHRFSSKLPYGGIIEFLNSNGKIIVKSQSVETVYKPTKRTIKKINYIKRNLIILLKN